MLMAIANPFGGAIGDLLAPAIVTNPSDLPRLLLIIAIVSSAVFPCVALIGRRPPTPPTRSAEVREGRGWEGASRMARELIGIGEGSLDWRSRVDFWLIAYVGRAVVSGRTKSS